jgi:hypothetical protein
MTNEVHFGCLHKKKFRGKEDFYGRKAGFRGNVLKIKGLAGTRSCASQNNWVGRDAQQRVRRQRIDVNAEWRMENGEWQRPIILHSPSLQRHPQHPSLKRNKVHALGELACRVGTSRRQSEL